MNNRNYWYCTTKSSVDCQCNNNNGKEFNSFHESLSSDVRLTTEESAFSHGNQDEKREHKN